MAPPPAASKKKQDEHTAADYYFDSYSHYGVSKRWRKRWRVGGGDWRAADSRPPAFTRGGMGPTRLSAAAAAARETLSHQNAPPLTLPLPPPLFHCPVLSPGIHEEMLKDSVRTRAYQHAIERNPHLFEGKVVLDVGCGTGILSLFAARAGAKHVYGIECSAIAEQATAIVKENGYADRVTIIRGKVEEIDLPVAGKGVDIIISEWMGYFLLYESMLDTVIYARDKWLAPGGILLPDTATLYVAGIEDAEYRAEKLDFWDDVYGFNMQAIKKLAVGEPLVDVVEPDQVATSVATLQTFDIKTMTKEDAAFTASFELSALRNDYIHALVAFFDVSFTACHTPVRFSTGPASRPTHWKQTVLYLDGTVTLCEGETVSGTLACAPNPGNPRDLDISLSYEAAGRRGKANGAQQFKMR
jgi:protein arginine N-methyltransferase 1